MTQVEFRSHFSGEKSASYGPGNRVIAFTLRSHIGIVTLLMLYAHFQMNLILL